MLERFDILGLLDDVRCKVLRELGPYERIRHSGYQIDAFDRFCFG